jgi:hypothetical protein
MDEPIKTSDRNPPEASPPPVIPRVVATPQPVLLPQTSGMAIASMVVGVIGMVSGGMCGCFPVPLLAIIFGHVSYSKITHNPQALTGKGFAIAGFTTGYVGLLSSIIMMIAGAMAGTMMAEFMKVMHCIPPPPRM